VCCVFFNAQHILFLGVLLTAKRLCVFFVGSVQGVGFRFTTERIAKHFKVMGFVKNLTDGRVELVAEGDERDLKNFLTAIHESELGSYIRQSDVSWEPGRGEFKHFGTKY
jgi:acylphosphatase